MTRTWTNEDQNRLISCRDATHAALVKEMENRSNCPGLEWVEKERLAVAVAANKWKARNDGVSYVTIEDVERVEVHACGHYDYASKLALYIAEFVLGVRE